MGKIKIHEIAKKLNLNSKEVLDKAKELGIDVKTHLSGVEESEALKIEESFSGKTTKNVGARKSEHSSSDARPKEEKTKSDTPVIIRREVINTDASALQEKQNKKTEEKKSNVGFVENERKKDFNIVYRNKPNKPLTVSELFGIKKETKKEEPKKDVNENVARTSENNVGDRRGEHCSSDARSNEEKQEPKNNVGDRRGEHSSSDTRPNEVVEKTEMKNTDTQANVQNSRPFNRDGNRPFNRDNGNRPFNRDGNRPFNRDNGNRPFNRDGNRPFNRDNGNRPFNRDGNRPFNRDNGNRPFNRDNRPLDERRIEKNIKDIMSADIIEKENVREYSNKAIDKQKNSRYEENKANKKPSKSRRNNNDYDEGKLKDLKQTNKLSHMFNEGSMLDYYDLTTERGKRNKKKNQPQEERVKQKIFQLTDITIPETITVKDLATELKKTSSEIIKKLLGYGTLATINNSVDFDTAFLIAGEYGITAHKKEIITEEDILFDDTEDKAEDLISRAPVVVVMGHVDHGKTSLLDAVRQTNVIEGEAGGITQHIGAYKVEVNGREITFLDTPGHEAFTSMRARGAQITDIAILVVAANDGVMPQTIEAINHAKAAGIPIVVAINKIDLEGANPEKVKQELTEYGLVPEEWGGDTIFVPISAKKRINIDNLLEMVLLVADMKELKVNPNKQAKGAVIEAKLDKAKGPIATMLVQRGCLDIGDTILVGSVIGRIRAMTNDKGQSVKKAGPSTPVEVIGLPEVPEAGETFYEVKDEKTAKHLMERRKRQAREKALNATSRVTLDDLFNQIEKGHLKQLNLIVKADVQGSVEAVKQSLEKLSNEEVQVKVIHSNVGAVTESDVTLAKVSKAIIIAFNVRPDAMAKEIAEKEEVEIKTYSVIYNAIEDVESAMKGMLDPVFKEVVIGNAEIRQVFKVSNVGTIAGCYVTNGKVARNAGVRLLRENIVVYEGKLVSLKRFKDDAKEVTSGYECGIQLEDYNDIKEGDVLEVYVMEEVKR